MNQAVEHLREQAQGAPAHEVLQHIVDILDLSALAQRLFVHEQHALVISRSIAELIRVAQLQQLSVQAFYRWLIGLDTLVEPSNPYGQAVRIARISSAKGKEYPHVILPYLQKR